MSNSSTSPGPQPFRIYVDTTRRETDYCVILAEGGIEWGDGEWRPVLQRIWVKGDKEECIRACYYTGGHFIPKPMELTPELWPYVLAGALRADVITAEDLQSAIALSGV